MSDEGRKYTSQNNYLHETLYTFCYIFGKFGHRDRARRTTEILCRDLSAPLSVARPLKERCKTMKKKIGTVLLTDLQSDGDAGTSTLEYDMLTIGKVLDP